VLLTALCSEAVTES